MKSHASKLQEGALLWPRLGGPKTSTQFAETSREQRRNYRIPKYEINPYAR